MNEFTHGEVLKHDTSFERHPTGPNRLIEVRCPYNVTSKKNGRTYPCNRLCVRVSDNAAGEAWCTSCKKGFPFQITTSGSAVTTQR